MKSSAEGEEINSKQSRSRTRKEPSSLSRHRTPDKFSKHAMSDKFNKPKISSKPKKKTSSARLPEGWTRGTFIVEEETLRKIKDFAYWERLEIKALVKGIFDQFFADRKVKRRP